MRIDSEVSLCDRARFVYPWMESAAPHMRRDFSIEDIGLILARNRFSGAVLTGLLADEPAETDWLLELAALSGPAGLARGVMTAVASSPALWDRWQQRHQPPWGPALLGVAQAPLAVARELASRGLRCTMDPATAVAALEICPDLRVLVRATAGQRFPADGALDEWRETMAPLESARGVSVLISSLINEAGPAGWQAGTYRPWVQHLLARFGAERILYGSGWPLCMHSGTWKEELACFTQALGAQTIETRELILGKNAAQWFGLSYTE